MSFLWLNTTVEATLEKGDLLLWSGQRYVSIPGFAKGGIRFLQLLDGTRDEFSLRTMPGGAILIPVLDRLQWLVRLARPLTEIVAGRPWLSRQLAYFAQLNPNEPDRSLDELAHRNVFIVGLGGVGSHVSFFLAGSGVGTLTLIDPDIVEASNLNRQILFSSDHFGVSKAQAVVAELRKRFPSVTLNAVSGSFAVDHIAGRVRPDLVLVCGGSTLPFERPELFSEQTVLLAGYIGGIAVIGPLARPRLGLSWPQMLELLLPACHRSLPIRGVPRPNAWNTSGATINGLIAAIAGDLIIRCLAPSLGPIPLKSDERMIVNMGTLRFSRERLGTLEQLRQKAPWPQ
jgi:hypothetical protein